ncbi:hypothetical protein BIFGAL_03143 [Bifidobacterium gallicum DSM 20093 = LMG 11596]|uniref:Uncharacterized protein n=1 Tax=Bifidobacterium gallicum DSM 20093 = LMG 11596 TaxID=561180 RepID=D1NTI5_9BIFI|nr:hypothetical protein BIFGAL_03143 [Bifidobacterium gallicum DSM 20093 = LMG 11596]
MIPVRHQWRAGHTRAPRKRGDDPGAASWLDVSIRCSPQARG